MLEIEKPNLELESPNEQELREELRTLRIKQYNAGINNAPELTKEEVHRILELQSQLEGSPEDEKEIQSILAAHEKSANLPVANEEQIKKAA